MEELNTWMWLINTDKGEFKISVTGNWDQTEAARKLKTVIEGILKLTIIAMIPRKQFSGSIDNGATIVEQLEPKDELGFDFMAGKKLWEICGRGAEYAAELTLLEYQMRESK